VSTDEVASSRISRAGAARKARAIVISWRSPAEMLPPSLSSTTSFVIAHRLSTIRDADTILVMSSGRIIEQGSHDEARAIVISWRSPAEMLPPSLSSTVS
jgi:hypothetical protein